MANDQGLQKALVQGITMGLPGLSVALGVNGETVWTSTAGYSDISRQVPVKPEDRFAIGSITKTFVAQIILQLVDEGVLDLTRTPADYLDAAVIAGIANADKATLRQLLNHQSGIPTWEFQPAWIRKGRGDEMTLGKVWGKTETLDYIRDSVPADHEPGQRYAYSNTNYTLLGLIVEAMTGNDALAETRRRMIEPLGLTNTFLDSFEPIPGGYANHYHYATPEFVETAGVHRGFPEIRPYLVESTAANLSPEWMAGGLVASARDLVRWAQAIRSGELLSPEMKRETFTYYPPREGDKAQAEYRQGIAKSNHFYDGRAAWGHSGGTLGFTAMMHWIEPDEYTVVVLTNVGGMHSGLVASPVGLFYRYALMPAVEQFMREQG